MNRCKFIKTLYSWVHIDQIEASRDNIGSMSHGFEIRPLAHSIRKIGLIRPPILIREGEGDQRTPFKLVSGFRRIAAVKTLFWNRIPCRILPDDTPPIDCLLLNLYDNLHTRVFNPVEKGMVLKQLMALVPEREVLETYMPLFDLPSHKETLRLFVEIERVFEPAAKDLLASGYLSMKAAKLLLEMNGPSREVFCRYLSAVGFSKNQQTQFIELIDDLCHMEKSTIVQLLNSPHLKDILNNEKMNGPQKASAVMMLLRKRRLPRLMKAEKRFKNMVEKLALPAGVRIVPPPFFEGPNYRIEFSFKSGRDLRKKLETLLKNEGVTFFEDPWEKIV